MKISDVVFDTVAVEIAEEAQGGLFVNKKKAAKIGVELLNTGARGNKIIVGTEVAQLHLHEGFLKAQMGVEARGAFAHVWADDAQFAHVEIIQTYLGGDADAPIHGLERSVAVKQLEGEAQRLIEEQLLAMAEKFRAAGLRGAYAAGRGDAPTIEKGFRGAGEIEEHLLAQELRPDGFIALEAIAVERVVPMRLDVNVFALRSIAAVVGLLERPAIGHNIEHVGDRGQHAGCELQNVAGIGIEAMAEFAISTERCGRFRRQGRAELGLAWQARAHFCDRRGDKRNFQRK